MNQTVSLDDFFPLPEGEEQYSLEFIEHQRAIKLSEDADLVIVAMVEPDNRSLRHKLELHHGKKLDVRPIEASRLSEYLAGHSTSSQGPQELTAGEGRHDLDRLAHDAPIVNLVNSIMLEGIRLGCSDIHLEAFENETLVRYRIDGVLRIGRTLAWDAFQGIAARIKVMANLNIIEKRLPQDGRLQVKLAGAQVEFRVSTVPIQEGESIVLRLFKKAAGPVKLDSLGFDSTYLEVLRQSCTNTNGLVLVTGPTGSGKTTTLNAVLAELRNPALKIITVEDPVENTLKGVNQVQTNEAIGLTFDTILQRLLRQDPDILMIGEIRDKKTAELAVRSALTGHLVLSTLHTNDALAAVTRLVNMGIEPYLLAGVLRAVSAQRLVRLLCNSCRNERPPTPAESNVLRSFNLHMDKVFDAPGCRDCNQSGYQGRIAIGEIFSMDSDFEDLVCQNQSHGMIVEHFKRSGGKFLAHAALSTVLEGKTTIAELSRAVVLIP